ncbi:MAG: DUF3035 domain-containing protein [Pseudomonadota bacterium]|nr:DUF3035 domain-containing protein [Pseudomonadota bacterium]
MRKIVPIALGLAAVALLSGCGKSGYDRARPDEFAVARQAPLVIPPDFALVPPQPGVARVQDSTSQQQTLEALFGSNTARSAVEKATIDQAGGETADPGIRSLVGDPATTVVDKGATTRDIVAAPQGDGQDVRVGAQ